MKTIRHRARRMREEQAPYGACQAGVVVMEGSRLEQAEENLRNLRKRAVTVSQVLKKSGIPHAVIGGLAVYGHVSAVDEAFTRGTRDLDILINRSDLELAAQALKPLGYAYRKVLGIPAFLPPRKSGPAKSRFAEGIHLVWAAERVRPIDPSPAPSLDAQPFFIAPDGYTCLNLESLLRMKLTSYRLKDRVHIQDLLGLKLITKKIRNALPPELLDRLKQVEEETRREQIGLNL